MPNVKKKTKVLFNIFVLKDPNFGIPRIDV
jgi:hypothetical protein